MNDYPVIRVVEPELIKQRLDVLYLTLNASLGDTFNALLHLSTNPPKVPYTLICKRDHVSLVSLMLSLFPMPPREIIIVPTQDGSFPLKTAQANTSIQLRRGFQGGIDSPGHIILWTHPNAYQRISPLSPHHIEAWRRLAMRHQNTDDLPRNAVIFFARRGIGPRVPPPFKALSGFLRSKGFQSQFSNVSQVAHYGEELIDSTVPLHLSIDSLVSLIYSRSDLTLIGLRSGIFDIVRFSQCKSVLFYDTETEELWLSMRMIHLPHLFPCKEILYGPNQTPTDWQTNFDQVHQFITAD